MAQDSRRDRAVICHALMPTLVVTGLQAALPAEPRITPATSTPPTTVVGERHYCFAKRKPTRPATFNFDDLAGWTVASHGNAKGEMIRTREAQIWSRYVAKVRVCLRRPDRIECRPARPMALPRDFDCVNIWVRADKWYVYAKPRVTMRLSLRLRDSSREEHIVSLGAFPYKDWFLAHRRVVRLPHAAPGTRAKGGDGNGRLDAPATLEAIIVDGDTGGKTAALYLDHVSFYKEELKPIQLEPQPAKRLFPTTPDTILPTCHGKRQVRAEANPQRATFTSRGEDGTLVYQIDPSKPGFAGVSARWDAGPRFRPLAGAGPCLVGPERDQALPADDPNVRWETLAARLDRGTYDVSWRMTAGGISAAGTTRCQLKGKSLVIDIRSPGGHVAGVRLGRCEGLERPKLVRVPFLCLRPNDPHVLCAQGLFVSAFIDWYVSDASTLEGGAAALSRTAAQFNGGCRYLPKTDGRRNDARARIFLTVSPRFDEVLPNIPNPPNPYAKMMVHRAWWDVGVARMDRIERMYRWGLRGAMMEYNGVIWERGTDFIRRAFYGDAGINVGADKMAAFSEKVRNMGYLFGLHTDFCIIPPGVFRCWDEDLVTRTSDGDWRPLWGRCYAVKVSRAEEIQRKYGRVNKEVFGTCCGYSDVTTALSPSANVDYDARVPMAGKFRGQFEAYGRMLRAECDTAQGPVISEGPHQWLYAGLPAGNYGQMAGTNKHRRPMLVDFDLLKIHPLQCDTGIGMPYMFYGRAVRPTVRNAGLHSDWFDRWIAWTLACGHIAQLTSDWRDAGLLKSFYMVQPAQRHYALVPVQRIRYFDGERLVTTSDAIRSGALERSQVCVEYANGLTVFVNGSWADDWLVAAAGDTWLLPPAGFLLHRPGKLLEYSALVGSSRVDYVETADACYVDGRGRWTGTRVLASDAAAACFRDDAERGVLWVVPAMSAEVIGFSPQHFGLGRGGFRVTAYGFKDALGDVGYRAMGDKIAIRPGKGAAAYKVVQYADGRPESAEPTRSRPAVDFVLSPRRWLGVRAGQPMRAKVVARLAKEGQAAVEVELPDGRTLSRKPLLGEGLARSMAITLPPPDPHGSTVAIELSADGETVQKRFRLVATEAKAALTDLMSASVPRVWGYCRRGASERVSSEPQGPGYARFQRASGTCGGKRRRAFAAPPVFDRGPHGYVFGEVEVQLPPEETALAFGIGINDSSPSPDGVVFAVRVADENGRTRKLFKAHHSNGPWRDERISLKEFAGQWVKIRFTTDCGPQDNATGDSARWAEPRIEPRGPVYDVTVQEVAGRGQ